jgi:hypothetical protein
MNGNRSAKATTGVVQGTEFEMVPLVNQAENAARKSLKEKTFLVRSWIDQAESRRRLQEAMASFAQPDLDEVLNKLQENAEESVANRFKRDVNLLRLVLGVHPACDERKGLSAAVEKLLQQVEKMAGEAPRESLLYKLVIAAKDYESKAAAQKYVGYADNLEGAPNGPLCTAATYVLVLGLACLYAAALTASVLSAGALLPVVIPLVVTGCLAMVTMPGLYAASARKGLSKSVKKVGSILMPPPTEAELEERRKIDRELYANIGYWPIL